MERPARDFRLQLPEIKPCCSSQAHVRPSPDQPSIYKLLLFCVVVVVVVAGSSTVVDASVVVVVVVVLQPISGFLISRPYTTFYNFVLGVGAVVCSVFVVTAAAAFFFCCCCCCFEAHVRFSDQPSIYNLLSFYQPFLASLSTYNLLSKWWLQTICDDIVVD